MGGLTAPNDKWCPTLLKPWSDFIDRQRQVFGLLYDAFPAASTHQVFQDRHALAGIGPYLHSHPIADEKGLETFMHITVENPVWTIVQHLTQLQAVSANHAFRLGAGIVFENHPHALGLASDEVAARRPPSTPRRGQLRPDQICICREGDGASARRSILYIEEYKAPHKLTAQQLRAALGIRTEPLNIYRDVVNRATIPTNKFPVEKFQYHAERLTASAITQTYHYMILSGLEYGLLTTGEILVFLRIDWADPGTLLYHLAEPFAEVSSNSTHPHLCTAVGQLLAFSLMSLDASPHDQNERNEVAASLETWSQDFDAILQSMTDEDKTPSEGSPGSEPITREGLDRSPLYPRKSKSKTSPGRQEWVYRKSPASSSSSNGSPPDTPCPPDQSARRTRRTLAQRSRGSGGQESREQTSNGQTSHGQTTNGQTSNDPADHNPTGHNSTSQNQLEKSDEQRGHEKEYCTQKCLLGLVRGGLLDPSCPNVARHAHEDNLNVGGKKLARERHTLDHARFLDLLREQLKKTLDDGISKLYLEGARGVLFKVTLLSHGYTFVAKGTVEAFIDDLQHEAAVYERLKLSQGIHVPVHLGAIDLRSVNRTYYYWFTVDIIHLMFLSWGGESIRPADLEDSRAKEREDKAVQSLRAIHGAGIVHEDLRSANLLINGKTDDVMIIDFERALILEPPRAPLAPLLRSDRNRRSRRASNAGNMNAARKAMGTVMKREAMTQRFSSEIALMGMIFSGKYDY
ncbi:hypothetical protein CDD83_3540 [Cordyceps sp. RAO-2017]|nr:hypothetical protein CDD83_3540 [Cordyceps sp. RAO-2017]